MGLYDLRAWVGAIEPCVCEITAAFEDHFYGWPPPMIVHELCLSSNRRWNTSHSTGCVIIEQKLQRTTITDSRQHLCTS